MLLVSCSNEQMKELKIQENDECSLNCPSSIAKLNDSAIVVIDRSRIYEINTLSGMMQPVDLNSYANDFAKFLAEISGQQLTDSTPIPPLALLGFGANASEKLFSSMLPTIDSSGIIMIPAVVFNYDDKFKFLFNDNGNIATDIPQGNFNYFLSDSIIMTNCAYQCKQNEKPENIPSIVLYVKQKSDEFVMQKKIELPRCEKENMAAENNIMNSIYTYVSQPKFATGNGKIFASAAGSIFEIEKDGTPNRITESKRTIYTFLIDSETITTVEGNDGVFSKIVEYDIDGEMLEERDFPLSVGKCKCCQYIGDKLYIISYKEQNFFLTIM